MGHQSHEMGPTNLLTAIGKRIKILLHDLWEKRWLSFRHVDSVLHQTERIAVFTTRNLHGVHHEANLSKKLAQSC